jgi:peptidyl-tRNA hydrolase, PTH1 family
VYLITGLGNPGKEYQHTRHNLGFLVLQSLAGRHHISIEKRKFKSVYGSGEIGTEKVTLLTPLTYMNRSGQAVSSFLRYFHIPLDQLIVVHDDLDLAWTRLRIVPNGGAAGHKGILSLIEHLKSQDFIRLRIGIGHPTEKIPAEAYVLQPFPQTEKKELPPLIDQACDAVETLLSQGLTTAMNRFNGRKISPEV